MTRPLFPLISLLGVLFFKQGHLVFLSEDYHYITLIKPGSGGWKNRLVILVDQHNEDTQSVGGI